MTTAPGQFTSTASDSGSRSGASECTWCGLPAGPASPIADDGTPEPVYCCYGCRIAHAVTQERGEEGAVRWTIVRLGIAIFFTMNLMAFTMTMWSMDVYDVQQDPFQQKLFEVFRWLSMILCTPVLLLLGLPLLQNAWDCFRRRIYSTDLLIAVGVLAAFGVSVSGVIRGEGGVYFEVAAMVLVAVTLGRWFEASGRQKAVNALNQLAALLPDYVTRVIDGREQRTGSADVQVHDLLRIRAGERFPVDGDIESGTTSVDEQVFTGESTPQQRHAGDAVLAGTVNLDGDVLIRATAGFREGSFGRLLTILQEARTSRGQYQQLADRISAWFLPTVTVVAIGTFALHLSSGFGVAISNALSVLLIACPCALGLATPLALWTALSTAGRRQVLFRSGEALERLADVRVVSMDKTGTLTTGHPEVSRCFNLSRTPDTCELRQIATILSESSTHPFSLAIAAYCRGRFDARCSAAAASLAIRMRDVRTVPGGGVQGILPDGRTCRLGSLEFAQNSQPNTPIAVDPQVDRMMIEADEGGASLVVAAIDGVVVLGFLLKETIRPEAAPAVRRLIESDLPVAILTGDRRARANMLLRELREAVGCAAASLPASSAVPGMSTVIAPERLAILSELRPGAKVDAVRSLRLRHGATVMVGDGINDAPALAASDVGMALGCGADVSRESAHVCLLSDDLSRIPWSISLARRTVRVIRQNLFWAFAYNSGGIAVAAAGFLNPALAAGLMIVSSLLVISNSLRLLHDPEQPTEPSAGAESGNGAQAAAAHSGGRGADSSSAATGDVSDHDQCDAPEDCESPELVGGVSR